MRYAFPLIIVALVAALAYHEVATTSRRSATLVLINGVVHTMDPAGTVGSAIALSGNIVLGVGSTEEVLSRFPSDSVIDLRGRTVLPGLIDGHMHVHGVGKLMESVLLYGLTSPEAAIDLVAERAKTTPAGAYIIGRGWDQNLWPAKEFPTAAMLDKVSGDHPVILIRVDGHGVWVNSLAMRRAGITDATRDPSDGKIVRDARGAPTGIFLDGARPLVEGVVPPQSKEEIRRNILFALNQCAALGLTEVCEAGANLEEIEIYREMARNGELPIRVYAAISAPGPAWELWRTRPPVIGEGGGMFTLRSVKRYMDGALGSRGAALFEEYSDDPGNRGITTSSESGLDSTLNEAVDAGYQPMIHAIGDRANGLALDGVERLLRRPHATDIRARIEHAQVIAPSDIARFATLGVLPSMEPVHATSDMYWAEARLGPARVKGAYAWGSLVRAGSIIVGGSDAPNDQLSPLEGIYAACTRRDGNGYPADGWQPQEKLTREEAVRSYTTWAAYGAFEEHRKGSLEPGKWADLTILSKDILRCDAQEILTTLVEATLVDGRFVYLRPDTSVAP